MLRSSILNSELISLLCSLGHTQTICICDAGLPIPSHVPCIDLALTQNVPDIHTVLELINSNLVVEAGIAAYESERNHEFYTYLSKLSYPVAYLSHEDFKKESLNCSAFVRTGECSPFANIILKAGVSF